MKYLLYCVFRDAAPRYLGTGQGVLAGPISIVSSDDLSVVVSSLENPDMSFDVTDLMVFKDVIELFHRQCAVIPLRFGTVMDRREEIKSLLRTKGEHYRRLLREIAGCVEMGIRIIIDAPENCREAFTHPSDAPFQPGKSYLLRRKSSYFDELSLAENCETISNTVAGSFKGLYSKFRFDVPTMGRPDTRRGVLLSLYFLVPRELVERFREAFGKVSAQGSARMMLSGPWPPYNFVTPEYHDGRKIDCGTISTGFKKCFEEEIGEFRSITGKCVS